MAVPTDIFKLFVNDTDGSRIQIELAPSDYAKVPRGTQRRAWVTDLKNGKRLYIRRASCGIANCLCDLTVMKRDIDIP